MKSLNISAQLSEPMFSFGIDLFAILQKTLDRAIFLYNFIREVLSIDVRASITVMHIRASSECIITSFDSDPSLE